MIKIHFFMLTCLFLGSAFTVADPALADINWRQCEGTKIRILTIEHPFSKYLADRLEAFEQKTGIQVQLDLFQGTEYRKKRFQELDQGQPVDGFMLMPGVGKLLYWELGWLMPLDDFIEDPALTAADWDVADFFDPPMQGASVNDRQIGIPINVETSLLAYRKDLFETFKIKVPATMEELEVAAGFFHRQEIGGKTTIGLSMRGKGTAATSQWADFLYSFGGRWTNGKGKSQISSPESLAAFRFYAELLRNYGPDDAVEISWPESTALFMDGSAAMIYDSNMFRALYENPEHSQLAGKVGYTMLPAGPAGRQPHVSSWSLVISGKSLEEHQKAAWLFIQWATDKEHALEALLMGIPVGRASAWHDEKFKTQDPFPGWSAASLASFQQGQPFWNPPVLQIRKIREIIGQVLIEAIQGKDVEEAAQKAMTLWMKQVNHAN
ncbi:MAG: sugar ABC transporter substrate-binding protein [bacterium]|nr:sugar ABC transporter substrate-binding protein [bacterium]